MKTTIIFYPNKAKRSVSTKRTPIYLRVCQNRVKAERRLDCKADLSDVEVKSWDEFMMLVAIRGCLANKYLGDIEERFQSLQRESLLRNEQLSPAEIIELLLDRKTSSPEILLMPFIESSLETVVLKNNNYSPGTKKNYQKAFKHFKRFILSKCSANMTVANFTNSQASAFKDFLESDEPAIERVGMSKVSSTTIIKKIKTLFLRAVKEELITKNPFDGIKMTNISPNKRYLSISQVKSIANVDLSQAPQLNYYRDFFLFCTFTGLSFADANNLSRDLISNLQNSRILLNSERLKTEKPVKQVMTCFAQEIVEKYQNDKVALIKNRLFPTRSYDKTNSYLKVVGAKAGIPFELSTSMARNTCRQLLGEAKIEDYMLINSFMGWSNRGLIHSRYYQITESKLLDMTKRFENYLTKNLR